MGLTYKALKHRDLQMNLLSKERTSTSLNGTETLAEARAVDAEPQFTAEHILQLCKFLAEKSKAKKNQQRQQLQQTKDACDNHATVVEQECKFDGQIVERSATFEERTQLTHTPHFELQMRLAAAAAIVGATTETAPTIPTATIITTTNCVTPVPNATDALATETKNKDISINSKCTTESSSALTQALTNRVSCSNCNSSNINNNNNNNSDSIFCLSSSACHNCAASAGAEKSPPQIIRDRQDKRDILLKIRRQIFERKRLRQLLRGRQQQQPYQAQQLQRQQQRLTAAVWRPW